MSRPRDWGRLNYFFWCFYLGIPLIGVYFLSGVSCFEGWTLWFPLLGVLGYLMTPGRPGPNALVWSLLSLVVVGSQCFSQWNTSFGLVTSSFSLDHLSGPYLFLTVTLVPVVILASLDSIRKNQKIYYFWILFLGAVLGLTFCTTHLFVFYVLFEVLGFPMFLLIGQYGPRTQRISAAYKFFVYTFGGSAFILPVLVYLQFWWGSTEVTFLRECQFTEYEQVLFFGLCAVPFAVKVPLVPFHLWLPEAHVEAPTPVSMLLAGLLLKTGGYAFIRFLLPVFPFGVYIWGPLLTALGLFSVLVASGYALVQVDMKRLIAYASVAHMSLVFLGIFSGVELGVQGGTYLMLAHGYTSAGLFAGIGVLYDRYHTRTVRYYGGLVSFMPIFAVLFFILTLGNLSFPFTGGFIGEFLILTAWSSKNLTVALFCGSTVLVSLVYSVWLYNRLFYGGVSPWLVRHQDLTPVELGVLVWCTLGCLLLGWGGSAYVVTTHECYRWVLFPLLTGPE